MEVREEMQKKHYSMLHELQNMARELPSIYQQRLPYDLLTGLANSLLDGTVFEIVSSMKEVQHLEERSLFNERIKLINEAKGQKQDLLRKHKEAIQTNSHRAHHLPIIKTQQEQELTSFQRRHEEELKRKDMKIILELDQKVMDQQSTLEKAGVPGFFVTNNPQELLNTYNMSSPEVEVAIEGAPKDEEAQNNGEAPSVIKEEQTRTPGVAKVKEEYIIHNYKPRLEEAYVSSSAKRSLETEQSEQPADESGEPPRKKVKLKGQNKRKTKDRWREDDRDKLCVTILTGKACDFGEKCRYTHDVEAYLENKMQNLKGECPSYRSLGRCPYGVTCRLSDDHFENMTNVVNKTVVEENRKNPSTLNVLSKKLMTGLRKHAISFPESDVFFKANGIKPNHKTKGPALDRTFNVNIAAAEEEIENSAPGRVAEGVEVTIAAGEVSSSVDTEKKVVTANCSGDSELYDAISNESAEPDIVKNVSQIRTPNTLANDDNQILVPAKNGTELVEPSKDVRNVEPTVQQPPDTGSDRMEIRLRPQEKKTIDFRDKLYLAPLTTVGNLPFRRICKRFGADITCGEMAMATNILQGKHSEWALLKRHESEDLFGVQLCGGYADSMTRCAELINKACDVDFVDINVGCPIDLVYKKGGGSALMERSKRLGQIVRGMASVLDIPLTVKMRTGVWEDRSTAHELVPKCREWGASMVTLHGRSREQRYTKLADWNYIGQCVKAADPMPIYGNGDVLSYEDYESFRASSGVAGTMIARGALIKPWIFTELKERRHWDIRSTERLDMLRDFTKSGLVHWGSDPQGVETTRRFLLEWQSFLYRYVPVGLLEHVPQRINERPPAYRGRDELETLMASANCADWIKISEMLLGPVPDSFTFLPKHKANAYK